MDPVSIAVNVIGITKSISMATDAIQFICSVMNAPAELTELKTELDTVKGYLQVLQSVLSSLEKSKFRIPTSSLSLISTLIDGLRASMQNLEDVLGRFPRHAGSNGSPELALGQRIKWRCRRESIVELRDKARQHRLDLANSISILQPLYSQASTLLMLDIQESTQTSFATLKASTARIQSSINDIIDIGSPCSPSSEKSMSWGVSEYSPVRKTMPNPWAMEESPVAKATVESDSIQLSESLQGRCRKSCRCQCHTYLTMKSFDWLPREVLGKFLLQYSNIPLLDHRRCTYPKCARSSLSFRLQYIFPEWLHHKLIHLTSSWSALTGQGASLHLSVSRMLPWDHDVYIAIELNQVSVLRHMLSTHQVLPTDTSPDGDSLLYSALCRGTCVEAAEFLLPLSKDVEATNIHGMSAAAFSWQQATVTRFNNKRIRMTDVFEAIRDRYEDDSAGSLILDAMLGYTDMSVEEALRHAPMDLYTFGRDGATPLHWAVRLQDVELVRLLLEWGADPNRGNFRGQPPLVGTGYTNALEMAEELVKAGADVNAQAVNGTTALIAAAQNSRARMVQFLLSKGADPNHRRFDGWTPLHLLVPCDVDWMVQKDLTKELMSSGANINLGCNRGWTPLQWALRYNDGISVRLFLSYGADVTVVDKTGKTILHLAAIHCSVVTTRHLLSNVGRHQVDPDATDIDGMTAIGYFLRRLPNPDGPPNETDEVTTDDVKVFGELLATIKEVKNAAKGVVVDENDVFYDAVENA